MVPKNDSILQKPQVSPVVSALKSCARAAAVTAILVGVFELLGWVCDIPFLKNLRSGQTAVGVSLAVAFVLSGLSLWLLRIEAKFARLFAHACAVTVLLIGLIVLLQYIMQRDFGIGELLFHGAAGLTGTPETALLFAALGLALLFLDSEDPHRRRPAQFLLIFVGLFALASSVGYIFVSIAPNKNPLYSWTILPASLTLFFLSLGALFLHSDRGIARVLTTDALGSDVARRLMPAALVVPPLLCIFCYLGFYAKWYDPGFGLAMLTTLNSALLTTLILRTAEVLNQADFQRRRTEQQRNELNDALQQAHAFREKVMDSAVFAAVALDREGRFTLVNRRIAEITGYAAEELIGQPFTMLLPADDRDREYERLRRTLQEGTPVYHAETALLRKDSALVTIAYGWSALFSEGKIIGLVGTGEDITERKRLEEQLLEARKLESIGRLAGGVAHDFNNMLTAIFGYAELLEMEVPADSDPARYVQNIQYAADRAAALTGQLLAFARRQMIKPKIINLNDLIRNLETMLRRLIGEHIKLVMETQPDLHAVCVDTSQFEQILINLVVNARDALPPEGGRIMVETGNVTLDAEYARLHEGVTPGEYVMLAVSDTGSGMDEAVRLQIFEPFFTTKEQGRGTGLGLATVYGIVKQAGGHIWLYSEVGAGTAFKIYLPRASEPMEAVVAAGPSCAPPRGAETLLIVEDEAAVRTLTTSALRGLGYHVLEAADGAAALRVGAEHAGVIDVLITDVVMPQMSGKELAERLMAARPALKVLYISGYTENTIVHHGVLESGIAFLPKPFTLSALSLKVREVLTPTAAGVSGD